MSREDSTKNNKTLWDAFSKSRNISEEKRDEVKRKLDQMDVETSQMDPIKKRLREDEEKGDSSAKQLLKYIEGLEDLKRELRNSIYAMTYGLVFEEHRDEIDDILEKHVPVLTERKELLLHGKPGEESTVNFLIEGDNLPALQLLRRTHLGKIDMIYIDPPYNTKNKDFIYGDTRVGGSDLFRHSKWLSFMSSRLEIAKELLSERGVIFISIDDNEQAPLKLLCDEKFGENNFVAVLHIEMSLTQGMKVTAAQDGGIVKNAEFVLVYSKTPNFRVSTLLYDGVDKYDTHFSLYLEEDNGKLSITPLGKFLKRDNKDINAFFDSSGMPHTFDSFRKLIERDDKFRELIYRKYSSQIYRSMMAKIKIPPDVQGRLQNKEIVRYKEYILHQVSTGSICQLLPLSATIGDTDDYEPTYGRRRIRGDMWKGFYADMMNVAKEGNVEFKNGKKPIRLIKQLAKWGSHKDSTILDFFAGSATTGEAVMELNKEDGGRRRFILCNSNENNICQKKTYARMLSVIGNYNACLKYFKVDFVPNTYPQDAPEPKLRSKRKFYLEYANELLKHVRELLELEKAINFEENEEIAIILTKEDLNKFVEKLKRTTECKCKAVYLSYKIFLSGANYELFQKKGITDENINRIPDYYHKELSK